VHTCAIVPSSSPDLFPPEVAQILEVLFLSFLIGLEREEHKGAGAGYAFGGVRTFPLIGLVGYGLGILDAGPNLIAAGMLVLSVILGLSYRHKLSVQPDAGATTELTGIGIYVVGALVARAHPWLACAMVVVTLLMLELKVGLEGLATRIPSTEIVSFAKFLLLTAVILPVVPDREFTTFHLNPFRTWLVVVAVSAVSYGGYLLERLSQGRLGVLASALLGGAYSSTVTTVVLAKRAATEAMPRRFAGSILAASGMMYLRLAVLVALMNAALGRMLALPLVALGATGVIVGALIARGAPAPLAGAPIPEPRNPLDLRASASFAVLFVAVLVLTHLAVTHLGAGALYGVAALMGVSDVDPFIMGLTQSAGGVTPLHDAAVGVLIAAASNNVLKAVYARSLGGREAGSQAAALLVGLAAAGLATLWLV